MGDVVDLKERQKQPKPRRRKLTKSSVDELTYDAKGTTNQVWWDTELSGFGVRLNPGGTKTFLVQYRNAGGKLKRVSLGKFGGQLTVAQARQVARETIADIVRGGDPLTERQEARNAPAELCFSEIFQRFLDEYAKTRRKTWKTDQYRLLPQDEDEPLRTDVPIARLHRLRPTELSREQLERELAVVHAQLSSKTPVEANRVAQTVARVINWGAKFGYVPREFYNILEFVDLNKETARNDYIRPKELPALAAALAAESLHWRAAFWLTLFVGARMKSETLKLRWEDVHLGVGEFTFRDTKNGTDHTLPMTPATRAIFEALPRTGDWVFPSRRKGTHLTDPKKAFRRIKTAAKFVDNITAHSLRDTASTYMRSKIHLPDGLNRAVLNHSAVGITDRYAHAGIDDVKMALEKLEAFILQEAGIEDFAAHMTSRAGKKTTRIEITRAELHELVWSMPLRDAATKLGMSDVGLNKVCKKMDVPTPPRGHWLRVRAGEDPVPVLKGARTGAMVVYRRKS